MREDAAITQKALQFSKSTKRRSSLCLSPADQAYAAVLRTSMREEVALTARVHKRRRAGPRPSKSKKGGNLRVTVCVSL